MTDFITKRSGDISRFETGAQRDSATGKGCPAHFSPLAMQRIAKLLERGAFGDGTKPGYGALNYAKGMPLMRTMDSLMRHVYQYLEGDKTEDHLAAVIFNAMAMIHTEDGIRRGILPASLDDMPSYIPKEKPNVKQAESRCPCLRSGCPGCNGYHSCAFRPQPNPGLHRGSISLA